MAVHVDIDTISEKVVTEISEEIGKETATQISEKAITLISNLEYLKFLNGASNDMTINGNVTNVEFTATPTLPTPNGYIIKQICLFIEDNSNFASDEFGDLNELANGLQLIIGSQELINFTNNVNLQQHARLAKPFTSQNNQRNLVCYFDVNAKVNDGDLARFVVRDNLSGLVSLFATMDVEILESE